MKREATFGAAIDRIAAAVKNFARAKGKPERYHETITVAFAALIPAHMVEHGDKGGWPGFAAANPELMDKRILGRFYRPETLASPLARRAFLPGDLGARPALNCGRSVCT